MYKFYSKCIKNIKKIQKSIKHFKELKYLQKTHEAVKFRGIAYCEFAYIEYRVLRIIPVHPSNIPSKYL